MKKVFMLFIAMTTHVVYGMANLQKSLHNLTAKLDTLAKEINQAKGNQQPVKSEIEEKMKEGLTRLKSAMRDLLNEKDALEEKIRGLKDVSITEEIIQDLVNYNNKIFKKFDNFKDNIRKEIEFFKNNSGILSKELKKEIFSLAQEIKDNFEAFEKSLTDVIEKSALNQKENYFEEYAVQLEGKPAKISLFSIIINLQRASIEEDINLFMKELGKELGLLPKEQTN